MTTSLSDVTSVTSLSDVTYFIYEADKISSLDASECHRLTPYADVPWK